MSKRLLCRQLPTPSKPALLDETEANHATRVLRLRDGDEVEALDGKGMSVRARLRTGGQTKLEFIAEARRVSTNGPELHLEISILKGDAMEWVVEKAVELGVTTLLPLITDHTVVQIKSKGPEAFQERWQKIADQALKQCGRLERMRVLLPQPIEEALAAYRPTEACPRIWCDERGQGDESLIEVLSKAGSGARVLIGPEGGWSEAERELMFSECKTSTTFRASLGERVLRAETAALFAVSVGSAYLTSTPR